MNKKYIIIGLCIILVALCGFIAFEMMTHVEYEKLVLPSGSTMEVPNDMKLVSENSGTYVYESDDCVVVVFNSEDKSIMDITTFAEDKLEIFGNDYERNTTVTDTHVYGCNLKGDYYSYFTSNNETHDNIIIFAKNKDVGDYIINSVNYIINNDTESNDVEEVVVEENPEPEIDEVEKEQNEYLATQDIDENGIIHGGQADGLSVDEFKKTDRDIREHGMI